MKNKKIIPLTINLVAVIIAIMMEFDVQYENNNQLVGYYTPYTSAMEEQLK